MEREELPPHKPSKEAESYMATFTPEQMELHELAVKMLGSSYFVERTHGFRKWKAVNTAASGAVKQPAK